MPAVTINLITENHQTGEIVLILVEDGPWPEKQSDWGERLSRVQKRIFDAIDVAVDGHLAAKYPGSKGKGVRVQIDTPNGTPSQLRDMVSKVREYLKTDNEYHSAIGRSPYIKEVSVVMGDDSNPFN